MRFIVAGIPARRQYRGAIIACYDRMRAGPTHCSRPPYTYKPACDIRPMSNPKTVIPNWSLLYSGGRFCLWRMPRVFDNAPATSNPSSKSKFLLPKNIRAGWSRPIHLGVFLGARFCAFSSHRQLAPLIPGNAKESRHLDTRTHPFRANVRIVSTLNLPVLNTVCSGQLYRLGSGPALGFTPSYHPFAGSDERGKRVELWFHEASGAHRFWDLDLSFQYGLVSLRFSDDQHFLGGQEMGLITLSSGPLASGFSPGAR